MHNRVSALESKQTLLLGAIAIVGSAASMVLEPTFGAAMLPGAAMAGTSVAGGIFANMLQAKLGEFNARWAAGSGVVLNHDLQKAFFRALREAARQTVDDYRRSFPYERSDTDGRFQLAVDEACTAAEAAWPANADSERLLKLLEESRHRTGWTNEEFFCATPMIDGFLHSPEGEQQCRSTLVRFVRATFVARVEMLFWEELKRDTAAWRAWMRSNLDTVVEHLEALRGEQKEHGVELKVIRDGLLRVADILTSEAGSGTELGLLRQRVVEAVEPRLAAIFQQNTQIRNDVIASLSQNDEILRRLTQLMEREKEVPRVENHAGANVPNGPSADDVADLLACFAPPVYSPRVARPECDVELERLATGSPVVHVVGMPGSGKAAVVARYLEESTRQNKIGGVVWHEPDRNGNETLDSFLAKVNAVEPLRRMSPSDQARQFMSRAVRRNQVVVINGLQFTDTTSFLPLINAAARLPAPARLILIGNRKEGIDSGFPMVAEMEVRGFSTPQLRQFLVSHGVNCFSVSQVEILREQTDGLPEAARAVVELVRELGWTAERVICDGILTPRRFQRWLEEIAGSLQEKERHLLRLLSVCVDTFNYREFEVVCGLCGATQADSPVLLEALQRRLVLQRQSLHRWRLHAGLANLHWQTLSETERRACTDALANHAEATARRLRAISGEQAFVWQQRAAHYSLAAGDVGRAARQMQRMKSAVKSLGCYDVFLNLCRDIPLAVLEGTETWLLYDYAHCCLITGRVQTAVPAIRRLAGHVNLDPDLSVASVRLYAEMLVEVDGDLVAGLTKMREVVSKIGTERISANVLSHATTVEVRLLTLLRRFEEAESLVRRQIQATEEMRSLAVGLTSWATICEQTGRAEFAGELATRASRLFAQFGRDKRGQAWTMSVRAFCSLRAGNMEAARRHLSQALLLKRDIGEVNRDYSRFLDRAATEFRDAELLAKIAAEKSRVIARQQEMRNLAPPPTRGRRSAQ